MRDKIFLKKINSFDKIQRQLGQKKLSKKKREILLPYD